MKFKAVSRVKNFHLPLPDRTYRELRLIAERTHRPATQLAREAIESWIEKLKGDALRREIEEYARANAGSEVDLDPRIESAAIEYLHAAESDEKGDR
jgi:predicted DNA-binding protein